MNSSCFHLGSAKSEAAWHGSCQEVEDFCQARVLGQILGPSHQLNLAACRVSQVTGVHQLLWCGV